MDRTRRIDIFMRAADAGSFARAARALDLSPSAVSRAIGDLEAALGVTVFYRTTRQVLLTEDGHELYRLGRDLLDRVADLEAAMSRRTRQLTGTLRVGLSVNISRYIISPMMAAFMRRHPDLHIELSVVSHPREMHAAGLDVLLRAGLPPDSGLMARKLAEQRFDVYAAPAYLEAAGVPQRPQDLARHRCVVHRPAALPRPLDEWVFDRDGHRTVVKIRPALLTDDREALIAAVVGGAGIMRIGMFDPALVTSGRVRKILPEWSCPGGQSFYAMYRRTSRLPPRVAAFLELAQHAFAAFDPEGVTMVRPARLVPPAPGSRRSTTRPGGAGPGAARPR
jgi:DNA-binding transcriptional LysR family regulator